MAAKEAANSLPQKFWKNSEDGSVGYRGNNLENFKEIFLKFCEKLTKMLRILKKFLEKS